MTPVWFRLLMEWERSGRFGLTIPFVYGALNRPEGPLRGATSFMKLQSFVTSLVDDVPDGSLIRLYNCATVNDLILARVTAVPNNCLSIPSSNSNKVALYVQKDIFPFESPSPRSDLQMVLWNRYGDCLEAEHFSQRDGTYQSFSEKESGLINNAFSRPDNEDD